MRSRSSNLVAGILLVGASLATAATAQTPDTQYVRAGAVIDVVNGELVTDQGIVVRYGRIESIGPAASLPVPAGAVVIDLSAATVLPGLIDLHTHLTADGETHGYAALAVSLMRSALTGVRQAARTLDAGFTTVRNVGAGGFTDVALRDAINAGDIVGPRMLVSGPALGITGGHCDMNLLPPEFDFVGEGVADGPWAIRKRIRENAKYGVDVIKFCATGGVLSKGTTVGGLQYTFEEMQAIVDEAHKFGFVVAAHAHGTEGIKLAIQAGVDSIEHASMLDDEAIELAVEHGTALSMDVYVSDYILTSGEEAGILPESLDKERQVGRVQRESFRRAHGAGVRIVFGTDAGVYPHGSNGRQFAYMVEWGMTPIQAIQAATIHAAKLLKRDGEFGSLAVGRSADLIAVADNPLDNVRALESVGFVMKQGSVYKDELSGSAAR